MVREKFVLFAIFVRSDINSLIAFSKFGKQFCEDYWEGEKGEPTRTIPRYSIYCFVRPGFSDGFYHGFVMVLNRKNPFP